MIVFCVCCVLVRSPCHSICRRNSAHAAASARQLCARSTFCATPPPSRSCSNWKANVLPVSAMVVVCVRRSSARSSTKRRKTNAKTSHVLATTKAATSRERSTSHRPAFHQKSSNHPVALAAKIVANFVKVCFFFVATFLLSSFKFFFCFSHYKYETNRQVCQHQLPAIRRGWLWWTRMADLLRAAIGQTWFVRLLPDLPWRVCTTIIGRDASCFYTPTHMFVIVLTLLSHDYFLVAFCFVKKTKLVKQTAKQTCVDKLHHHHARTVTKKQKKNCLRKTNLKKMLC